MASVDPCLKAASVTVAEFVIGLLAALNMMVWCRVLQFYSVLQDIGEQNFMNRLTHRDKQDRLQRPS